MKFSRPVELNTFTHYTEVAAAITLTHTHTRTKRKYRLLTKNYIFIIILRLPESSDVE